MKTNIYIVLLLLYTFSIYGQENNTITFRVSDTDGAVSFSEFYIGKSIFFLSDENGVLHIDKNMLSVGDTMKIQALGYDTKVLVVNDYIISKNTHDIKMVAKYYSLSEATISNNFDALEFFNKNKKWRVSERKRTIHVIAKSNYVKNDSEYVNRIDTCDIEYPMKKADYINDTTIFRYIKQTLRLSKTIPWCYTKRQKLMDFKYLGLNDGYLIFETTALYKFKYSRNDRMTTLVYIDKHGMVVKDETQYIAYSEKEGVSLSYILSTKYNYNEKKEIEPTDIKATIFIPQWNNLNVKKNTLGLSQNSEVHIEIECKYE